MNELVCKICGKSLPDSFHKSTRYCSDECRREGSKRARLEYYHRNRGQSVEGREERFEEWEVRPNGRLCVIFGEPLVGRQVYVCGKACQAAREKRRYGSLHYRPTGETADSLIEITQAAEQCGMSYGKYVAAMAAKGARK